MATYAIFGATGNVGGSILEVLLDSPGSQIHAYCRTKEKLFDKLPMTRDNNRVKVFEGSTDNAELVTDCLKGSHAAFLAIAVKTNQPGTKIAQDTAHNIVTVMERMKDRAITLPKLIVLSSASTEHRLMSQTPSFFRSLTYAANSNIYHDLEAAEKLLRSKSSLTSMTFIKPSALTHDKRRGHALDMKEAKAPVSFLDLAAGMIEVADADGDQYDGKAVAVNATSQDVSIPYSSALTLLRGLLIHFFPLLWKYI